MKKKIAKTKKNIWVCEECKKGKNNKNVKPCILIYEYDGYVNKPLFCPFFNGCVTTIKPKWRKIDEKENKTKD